MPDSEIWATLANDFELNDGERDYEYPAGTKILVTREYDEEVQAVFPDDETWFVPRENLALTSKSKQTPVQKEAADLLTGPTGETVLASIREHIDEVVTKARTNALPAILGTATVSLIMEIPDSTTPVDAVNQVMQQVSFNGLRAYTFLVRDEVTQEVYAVRDGQMALLKPVDEEE